MQNYWLTMYYASFFFIESKLCVYIRISISASEGNILIISYWLHFAFCRGALSEYMN